MSTFTLSEYLDTNHPVASGDIDNIQAVIQGARQAVFGIDDQLKTYNHLLSSKTAYISSIERHGALLEPIRQIPNDILLTIFHECPAHPGYHKAAISCKHPSVLISHVCTKWRALALNDPGMWSVFTVSVPAIPDFLDYRHADYILLRWAQRLNQILEATNTWLTRSANQPLALCLQIRAGGGGGGGHFAQMKEHLSRLLELLCSVSSRWRDVDLHLKVGTEEEREVLLYRIIRMAPEDVPILRSLYLQAIFCNKLPWTGFWTSKPSTSAGIFEGAQLRSLAMDLSGPLWTVAEAPASWATLTRLVLELFGHGSDDANAFVLDILGACPALVDLAVNLPVDPEKDSRPLQPPHLQHPHLQSLRLLGVELPSKALAYALELPSLTSLHLSTYCYTTRYSIDFQNNAADVVFHWLTRFGPQLRNVTFIESLFDNAPFAEVMACFNMLVTLKVASTTRHLPDYSRLSGFDWHAVRSLDTSWLPKLETLDVNLETGGMFFTEESLLQFIVSHRQLHGAGLREVKATFTDLQRMDLKMELEKNGVDMDRFKLNIAYPEPPSLERPFVERHDDWM